jgi:holliday junction DNA helicase RuvB
MKPTKHKKSKKSSVDPSISKDSDSDIDITSEAINDSLHIPVVSQTSVSNQGGSFRHQSLRPDKLKHFLGQEAIKSRLSITLKATKGRGECLPHQLLAGPPGLGKTTLAQILAHEMGCDIKITSGPSLEKPGDLAGTLVSLEENDILFIDEIHRLSPVVEEFLYPAMEDRKLDILLDEGGATKTMRINLKPFTLIGATTKPGALSAPLRSRFQTIHKMEMYTNEELKSIVLQSAEKLDVVLHEKAAKAISKRSRGTPRTANNQLLWVRDYVAAVQDSKLIDEETTLAALKEIDVDEHGLDSTDRKILETLVTTFKGGPVGIASLAISCGEESSTIEDIHEPFLISEGYIKRSATGRIALKKAFDLFPEAEKPISNLELFN